MANRPGTREVRRYYDTRVPALAESYLEYRWRATPLRREHYAQTRETLVRELDGRRFDRLVEIGAGPCVWTELFTARAGRVIVIDLSMAMLHGCTIEPEKVRLCCAEAQSLPLRSESADAVCTIRAFEYFSDRAVAVREFHRVLKPGGYLLVVTKNRGYRGYGVSDEGPTVGDKVQMHTGTVTPEEAVALLSTHAFTGIQVRPVIVGRSRFLPLWRVIRMVRRRLDPRWPRRIPRLLTAATESFMVTATKEVERE